MFCLVHADFSLVPHPDDPTQWRGVAHTPQGLPLLLSFGATQACSDSPIDLFTWSPSLCPPSVLVRHAPNTHVVPLTSSDQHARVWATQDRLRWPPLPEWLVWPCTCTDFSEGVSFSEGYVLNTRRMESHRESEPDRPLTLYQGDPPCTVSDLWAQTGGPLPLQTFDEQALTVTLDADAAQAFRYACLQHLTVTEGDWDWLLGVETARSALQGTTSWAFEPDPHPAWTPLALRNMQAFFDSDTPPLGVHTVPPEQWPLFYEVAQKHSPCVQRQAFARAMDRGEVAWSDPVVWAVVPQHAAHWAGLAVLNGAPFPSEGLEGVARVFHERMVRDDRAFFEAVAHSGPAWSAVLAAWETTSEGRAVGRAWDRHWSGVLEDPLRWVRSLEGDEGVFLQPIRQSTGAGVRSALNAPAFWEGLVGHAQTARFWANVKSPRAHPEWMALWERKLLETLRPFGAVPAPCGAVPASLYPPSAVPGLRPVPAPTGLC
jgi:hypothetical protein